MVIGIDVSQVVYKGTGVARYVEELVLELVKNRKHTYVLFGSSLRRKDILIAFARRVRHRNPGIKQVFLPFPPLILDVLWNRLHVLPVERFTGRVDVFWSSDWCQPPLAEAAGITTVHDVTYRRYPREAHSSASFVPGTMHYSANILATQERRMKWVAKECGHILCDSVATKKDVMSYYRIPDSRLRVVYPGI